MSVSTLQQVRRVLVITLFLNLLVAGSELWWASLTHSLALMADGYHSVLDGSSNIIGILALTMAMKPPDDDHPYGHRKFEALASMVISFFIFLTCWGIASESVARIFYHGHDREMPIVTMTSYLLKFAGLAVNLWVTWYERKRGRELKSDLLLADAQHTTSDVFVSISVLLSFVAVQLHWQGLDIIVALLVVYFIFQGGYGIILVHLGVLVDEAVLDPAEICRIVLSVPGVRDCHHIRSRGMRDNVFIDLHIHVDGGMTIRQGHEISHKVEAAVFAAYDGSVTEVLVHVEDDGHAECRSMGERAALQ